MFGCDCMGILFSDVQKVKPILSARTIHLRRMSQENHVRRMKMSHEMKKSQLAFNLSGFPLLSIPKELNNSFRTPFSSAKSSIDIFDTSSLTESDKSVGRKLSYSNISLNIKPAVKGRENCTKLTPVKKTKTSSEGTKFSLESHNAKGDVHWENSTRKCACENRKNSCIQSRNESLPSANKTKKTSLPSSYDKLSAVFNSIKNRQRINETASPSFFRLGGRSSSEGQETATFATKESKRLSYEFDSSEKINKNKTPVSEKRNIKILQKKQPSVSKIPISLTRLERKNAISSFPDCSPGQSGEMFFDRIRSLKERSSESTADKKDAFVEKGAIFKPFRERSKNTISASSFSKRYSFENSMYPVSAWLDSVIVGRQPIENPDSSQLLSPFNKTYSVSSSHSGSQESESCLDPVVVGEDFGNGQYHCKSESVGSAEYYDTSETECPGVLKPDSPDFMPHQRGDGENWEEESVDDVEENGQGELEDSAEED